MTKKRSGAFKVKKLPDWLFTALTIASLGKKGPPYVILHEVGRKRADDIVVMRVQDFEDWSGTVHDWPDEDDDENPLSGL